MARPYRSVPNSFAEFSVTRVTRLTDAELFASGPYGCRGCGANAAIGYLDSTHETLCEGCLRYHLGYEQAEERNVRLILSSAVAGALAAGAPEDMIRVAFEDALRNVLRIDADPND
jgi:hypothetical protein